MQQDSKQHAEQYHDSESKNVETSIVKEENDGYKRAGYLRKVCQDDPQSKAELSFRGKVRVSYDSFYKIMFCPLCKIASTFWTRVFKMLEFNQARTHSVKTPFDVPISQAPASRQYVNLQSGTVDRHDATESFRFMFVRNPYSMVFSAYVDKIVGPNPTMWKTFGEAGVKLIRKTNSRACGSDLTFTEFLQLILYTDKSHRPLDCHVKQFFECKPCAVNYTYIGKMETFKDDTYHILNKFGQTQTLEVFNHSFSALHAEDAIDDSVSGPFSWKNDIVKCMPWAEALGRVWRKLQIRGVVGASKFPLSDEEASLISKEDFKKLVVEHGKTASSPERSQLKQQAYQEAFNSVPNEVLEGIRTVYLREFKLFGYDDRPDELYNKQDTKQQHGMLEYSNIKEDIQL